MGKTETIRKRRVDVYLGSEIQKERWNEHARKRNTSLSRLVISVMETHMGEGLPENVNERISLKKSNEKLEQEIESLKAANHRLEKFVELLEKELNKTKNVNVLNPGQGFKQYSQELVKLLQQSKYPIPHHQILKDLNIDSSDTEMVQGISKQLDALSEYGLLKYNIKGWIWNGK